MGHINIRSSSVSSATRRATRGPHAAHLEQDAVLAAGIALEHVFRAVRQRQHPQSNLRQSSGFAPGCCAKCCAPAASARSALARRRRLPRRRAPPRASGASPAAQQYQPARRASSVPLGTPRCATRLYARQLALERDSRRAIRVQYRRRRLRAVCARGERQRRAARSSARKVARTRGSQAEAVRGRAPERHEPSSRLFFSPRRPRREREQASHGQSKQRSHFTFALVGLGADVRHLRQTYTTAGHKHWEARRLVSGVPDDGRHGCG